MEEKPSKTIEQPICVHTHIYIYQIVLILFLGTVLLLWESGGLVPIGWVGRRHRWLRRMLTLRQQHRWSPSNQHLTLPATSSIPMRHHPRRRAHPAWFVAPTLQTSSPSDSKVQKQASACGCGSPTASCAGHREIERFSWLGIHMAHMAVDGHLTGVFEE